MKTLKLEHKSHKFIAMLKSPQTGRKPQVAEWVNKQVLLYNGILLSNKSEWTTYGHMRQQGCLSKETLNERNQAQKVKYFQTSKLYDFLEKAKL